MAETLLEAIALTSLPAVKQALDGGVFCGVVTLPDGKHYAVVCFEANLEKRLGWKAASDWAVTVGGQLPSRAVARSARCRAVAVRMISLTS